MSTEIYAKILEIQSKNEGAALCTIVRASGSTPRHAGSKLLALEDGSFLGTVGGGELESRVLAEAQTAIRDGRPRTISYSMSDPARGDPGVCGGQVDVFIDPILPPAQVVVIGGGHVGKAVAHLAKWLGFRVGVSDDRPEFCTPEANPAADTFYPVPMGELPHHLKITRQTYLVLTTRNSGVDVAGLPSLLASEAAYIGVIGSKRRWATTVRGLKEAGVSEAEWIRVRSPIGLEIQAETPEEIAVSILAEIVALKNSPQPLPVGLVNDS